MARRPKTWKGSLEHVDGMCERMLSDLLLGNKLPSDRYFLLNYEELMTSPITTLVNLFSTLNMEFDIVAADALYNHTRIIKDPNEEAKNSRTKLVKKYYSTYRTAENDIYKWKKQPSVDQIRNVEENCVEFMK